jgi:MFS family permease
MPKLAGNGRFVIATAIDSAGTGLVLAFTVIYFVKTTSVSLAAIGLAMTVARLLALPTSMMVGPLIDRFTARRTAVAGNIISAAGYTSFLAAKTGWAIVVVVYLVQVGHTTYWTSSAALVGLAAPPDRRPPWFAFIHAVRNGGLGIGAALGGLTLALGQQSGLRAIVIANAASYVLSVILLVSWRPRGSTQPASTRQPATSGQAATSGTQSRGRVPALANYRSVMRDLRYTLLMSVNLTLVFAQMLISILLALYIIEALHRAAWIAGALLVLNTIQVAVTQTVISRRMERCRATRVIAAGAVANAAAFGLLALLYVTPGWAVIGGLFVAMIIFSFGEVIAFPAIDNLSIAMAQHHIQGRYLAVFQLSWIVGQIAAPGILTLLLTREAVLPMVFLLGLSLLALPLLLALERMPKARTRYSSTKLGLAEES